MISIKQHLVINCIHFLAILWICSDWSTLDDYIDNNDQRKCISNGTDCCYITNFDDLKSFLIPCYLVLDGLPN